MRHALLVALALVLGAAPARAELTATGRPGPLMFIGGGPDQDDLMREFAKLAGGKGLVIVPLASGDPAHSGKAYVDYLKQLGYPGARTIIPRQPAAAADLAAVRGARGLFFSGGDQARILTGLRGPWRQAVGQAWRAGAVVGGTSAGAMVWGGMAIMDGNPMETAWYGEDAKHEGIRLDDGLGFAKELVVDTHFAERGRIPRLAYAVARLGHGLGLGVDPRTAAIVWADGTLQVKGRGTVTVVRVPAQQLAVPLGLHDVHIDFLAGGSRGSLPELTP